MSVSYPKKGKSKRGQWTKAQRDYVERAIGEGCILCGLLGMAGTPAAWHHEKQRFHGSSMRAPHQYGLPLCPYHHTDGPDSVHNNPKGFTALAGMTEAQLVDWCQEKHGWLV